MRAMVWLVVLFSPTLSAEENPAHIAIVRNSSAAPFEQAADGFTSRIMALDSSVKITQYNLDGSESEIFATIDEIYASNPVLIFAMGSTVLRAFSTRDSQVPIVASMVLNSEEINSIKNATGTILDASLADQFDLMRTLLPEARNIGVLYNPEYNQTKVERAAKVATEKGLNLTAIAVESPKELPVALSRLTRSIDVLWGIPDSLVLTSKTSKNVLLESFRRKIPLTGPSPAWTRAGALYSIDFDYTDIGEQSANMAIELMDGTPIEKLPVQTPRTVHYSLNLNTAELTNVQLDEVLIRNASAVTE
jgi:putative ABC transport system substrate-binding protein